MSRWSMRCIALSHLPAFKTGLRMPPLMAVPLVVLGLAVVALGVWPSLMNGLTAPAAHVLLAGFIH